MFSSLSKFFSSEVPETISEKILASYREFVGEYYFRKSQVQDIKNEGNEFYICCLIPGCLIGQNGELHRNFFRHLRETGIWGEDRIGLTILKSEPVEGTFRQLNFGKSVEIVSALFFQLNV